VYVWIFGEFFVFMVLFPHISQAPPIIGLPVLIVGVSIPTLWWLTLIMLSVLAADVWHWPVWGSGFFRDIGLLMAAVMAGTTKTLCHPSWRSVPS
jgi:hypothetical protein